MTVYQTTADLTDLLATIEKLALSAGEVIMNVRSGSINARSKSDMSPVTEADEKAEKIIIEGLSAHYPGIPIVAEESASAGVIPNELGDIFFLVDPLDGTKEFISGREDFTVNIALIKSGEPVTGVVFAPAHGVIYSGDGAGATKSIVVNGEITARTSLNATVYEGPIRVVASRSHMTAETETYLAEIPGCQTVNIGSSLKFCLVAEGKADLYPRFGRTMEWDTAAGDAVLRATGGSTMQLNGSPLAYGKRNQADDADFANPHFISKVSAKPLAKSASSS